MLDTEGTVLMLLLVPYSGFQKHKPLHFGQYSHITCPVASRKKICDRWVDRVITVFFFYLVTSVLYAQVFSKIKPGFCLN